MLQPVM